MKRSEEDESLVRAANGVDRRERVGEHILSLLGVTSDLPIDPELDPDDPGEPSRDHRRSSGHVHRAKPGIVAAIACGGFVGTLGRYEVLTALPARAGHFPIGTFLINTSGSLLIGFVLTLLVERFRSRRHLREFCCVGVLGGWTTMSTLAVEADTLVKSGFISMAFGYMTTTLVAGVCAVALGIAVARSSLFHRELRGVVT
ncbi:MAG: CrcB family protein [Actinobacteria bacterium]|nr:CrcB family protein [Actinomycetota bacterium]